MGKLSIFDIVALAKAGYKAADIKELTELEVSDNADSSDASEEKTESTEQPPTENPANATGEDKAGSEDKENNVDYKKLYEAKCAELEAAQKSNAHQNQPINNEQKTTVDDIVRTFM